MVERDEWLAHISEITQWRRGGERAPHKSLLLLYLMGRIQQSGSSKVTFGDADRQRPGIRLPLAGA